MQVEELFDLTTWIHSQIVDKQLIQKFQQLQKILQNNTQANQEKQPFEEQRDQLLTVLSEVPLSELSTGQIDVLRRIGIAKNVGTEGVSTVEDTLFRNALDIASSAQKIQESIQEINSGVRWAQQVRDLLTEIIDADAVLEIGKGVMLRVHFTNDAHLSNLTEFKDWGKTWWEIGRGISMAHGESPENISVVGASRGSIILSLLSGYAIARTASEIIMETLKVVEKVYDIKKKAEEVKALKLANKEAEKALEDAAEAEKQNGLENIINQTIDNAGIDRNTEGDKVNELSSSIRKLADFIEKGGEVDFVIPDENEDTEEDEDEGLKERKNLRVMFKEVRTLEQKVHQIEHKNSNN